MKRIVQTFHFDINDLESHGFKTDAQKRSIACVAELVEEIRSAKGPFGMMLFFISDADLFKNHPVTIWSNLNDQEKLAMFDDYVLNRLKLVNAKNSQPPTNGDPTRPTFPVTSSHHRVLSRPAR